MWSTIKPLLLILAVISAGSTAGADDVSLQRAEIVNSDIIYLYHAAAAHSLSADNYSIKDHQGREIEVSTILPDLATRSRLIPSEPLDKNSVYWVQSRIDGQNIRARFDGWFRNIYSDRALGATVADDGTHTDFAIFAPRATQVILYLYESAEHTPKDAVAAIKLESDEMGVWSVRRAGDLHGIFYDFTVHGVTGPGTRYYETHPVHISDPYARVVERASGKSRVWRSTRPARPLPEGRPPMEDVVAYEVHVQDFTDRLPSGALSQGPLRAMVQTGLTNQHGHPIGFDYLVDLGINTVHLMPVQEFLHHPDLAWKEAFGDDPEMKRLGIADENYQWGYRTTHAFAIENRFGNPRAEPGSEREAFRDLVQAFHDKGIAVIVDIVPNHTGENMDGRERLINFNVLDKAYYYRTDDNVDHIGPFGNEVKTEDRPMVQRWVIDQCVQLIEEFGIDGFRIDLAGQIDEQTLKALRAAVGDDILIYGEPWIDVTDPYIRSNPDWDWYKEDSPITFFQDEARDAFKGSPFALSDKLRDRGYAGGNFSQREEVMRALQNAYPEESSSPNKGLNYLDIHDNWALADRFAQHDWNGLQGVDEARYRIAAGLLFTSIGPIVLHGGSEIMRSKGIAPEGERSSTHDFGTIHLKGRDDTYNLRTPNQFVWDNVGTETEVANFSGMQAWWQGLIDLRLSERGKPLRRADPVPEAYYDWILPENENLLGYIIDETLLVLVNIGEDAASFDFSGRIDGAWQPVADGKNIFGPKDTLAAPIAADALTTIDVPATSLMIWAKLPAD